MHQVKQLQAVALLACAVTVVEAFALLSRPIGLRSFRNVGVQMAAPTQDKMQITPAQISDIANDLKSKHTPAIAKEIDALFAPLTRELPPTKVKLDASLPSDLPGGALLRIGPNPRAGSSCRGFLDGDGMLVSIVLRPPEERADYCTFSTAWVRTAGYEKEEAAGKDLFQGTIGQAPRGWPVLGAVVNNFIRGGQAVKDSCNTAVTFHAGKILALMEQCRPSEISVSQNGDIRTVKALSDLEGAIPFDPLTGGALSAHSRIDAATGEKIAVSYATGGPGQGPPTARHDVWSADGSLAHSATVALPAPIMIHDLAITQSRSILFDLPLTVRIEKAFLDRFLVEYEKDTPARLGLLPRYGTPDQVQWFDVQAGVVLHSINAYDRDDGFVVVQGMRAVPASPGAYIIAFTPSFPYEWILDPRSGKCVQERYLSETPAEFPSMNPYVHGTRGKFVYALSLSSAGGPIYAYGSPQESPRFDSLVKFDLETGAVASKYTMPPKRLLVAEPMFVPKIGKGNPATGGKEDDGYILVMVSDIEHDKMKVSKMQVFDASDLSMGPVSEVDLPELIPFGLHSEWVPFESLGVPSN